MQTLFSFKGESVPPDLLALEAREREERDLQDLKAGGGARFPGSVTSWGAPAFHRGDGDPSGVPGLKAQRPGTMASILDEYEDSLSRSAALQPGCPTVGIPHSGKEAEAREGGLQKLSIVFRGVHAALVLLLAVQAP